MTKNVKVNNKVTSASNTINVDVLSKISTESKMSKATVEYIQLIKQPNITRKVIIESFIANCGLTPAGAATYYNTIKKKLTKPK